SWSHHTPTPYGKWLKALRTMVLQNRVVLDLLTASSGGVCARIGTGCCTFIPDNSGDGGLITQAIKDMVTISANPVSLTDFLKG
uniref:Uncharacterized protein n=1 Tax=Neogobius melanostomus TaxID=47308 RepID=A0A8C6U7L9_9GOBI